MYLGIEEECRQEYIVYSYISNPVIPVSVITEASKPIYIANSQLQEAPFTPRVNAVHIEYEWCPLDLCNMAVLNIYLILTIWDENRVDKQSNTMALNTNHTSETPQVI